MPKLKTLNDLKSKTGGSWKLDDRHKLTYVCDDEDQKEALTLEASLVSAEENSLVVSVTGKQENGRMVTSLAQLKGAWRANDSNQLEFEIERKTGKNDVITFTGSWTLNENHEIIYSYQNKRLKNRTAELQTLTFKGSWDLWGQNELVYLIEGSDDSSFRFRGAFQTPSILAKKGEVRYQLGAEAAGEKGRFQTLAFFGTWKLSDALGLDFELDCEDGEKRVLKFGAEFRLTEDASVTAKLTTQRGDALGIEVVLNKEFLDGKAQAFVRLRKSLEDSAIEAGITIPW